VDQWHAFGLTLACEVPAMLLLARNQAVPRVLLAAVSVNCLTHPMAWRMAMLLSPEEYRSGLWLIESGVVLVEAVWYRSWLRAPLHVALGWSVLANAASLGIGWLLWQA